MPTIRVSAREVIVDVLVTDSSARPVHGLKASDFTVEENGKPQTIRSFYESTDTATPSKTKPAALLAGEYANSQSIPASGPVTIFLLDQQNGAPPFDIRGVITRNLQAMPVGAQVGIWVLSPSGLHTLQPITTDRDLLIRALSTPIFDQGTRTNTVDPVKEWTRYMTTLRGLNQLAAYLSGISGRKNLFWFTRTAVPNPPVLLMRDGGLSWGLDVRSQDMSLVHHTMDTYEMLTAARVAVYPVMLTGLGMGYHPEPSRTGEDRGRLWHDQHWRQHRPALPRRGRCPGLRVLLALLPPAEGRLSTATTITSPSPWTSPVSPSATARDTTPSEPPPSKIPPPGPELMKASMEGNALPATQILFDAAIRPVPPPDAKAAGTISPPDVDAKLKKTKAQPPKTYPYQIVYGFPASQIAFLEDEYGKLHGAVEFDVVAYDVNRTRVALFTQTVTMPLTWDQFDQFAAGPFQFTQQIDLPPGQLWIHVGILDTVSNRVGTLEFPLMVGSTKARRGFAFGPTGLGFGAPQENPLPCQMPCSSTSYQPPSGGVSSGPTR